MWISGGVLAAITVVAIAMTVATSGSGTKSAVSGGNVKEAAAVRAEFAGIPQKGLELGAPNAPATMMVFADLQCPFCAHFDNDVLPSLIQRYVRPGKLRLVFQPIAILGPQSDGAARATASASLQNRGWQYAALFYRNQGTENTGYVTDKFLNRIATGTSGLDMARFKAGMAGQEVAGIVSKAQAAATTAQVSSTPTFMVGKTGATLEHFEATELKPKAFYGRLDALTR